jgi:TatD DNase family protein
VWVDINVHLELMSASTESVNQAADASSVNFIATGTHPDQWRWLVGRTHYLAFGLHPQYAADSSDWLGLLEHYLRSHPCSALGEVGLDFRPQMPAQDIQQLVFEDQLALAKELDRPVIIHAVKSHTEVISTLKSVGLNRFVIHAFLGSEDIAAAYLTLGGYLSAGGLTTRTPRPRALDVFRKMPTHRLLLETDAPDLPLTGIVEGSPEHLPIIGRSLAADLEISVSALEQLSYTNACVLFDHDFAQ